MLLKAFKGKVGRLFITNNNDIVYCKDLGRDVDKNVDAFSCCG